jgi:hypothetical protein
MMKAPDAGEAARLDHGEVRRLCGDIADWKISAILATGAEIDDIEVAVAWAAGEDDVMGEARRPLVGAAGAVYDIITADEEYGDEDRGL